MFHGIYAGDVYQLSALALLPYLMWLERSYGSFSIGALAMIWKRTVLRQRILRPDDHRLEEDVESTASETSSRIAERIESIRRSSVYTFRQGLETLPSKLVEKLREAPNVTLENGIRLNRLALTGRSRWQESVSAEGKRSARVQTPSTSEREITDR